MPHIIDVTEKEFSTWCQVCQCATVFHVKPGQKELAVCLGCGAVFVIPVLVILARARQKLGVEGSLVEGVPPLVSVEDDKSQ